MFFGSNLTGRFFFGVTITVRGITNGASARKHTKVTGLVCLGHDLAVLAPPLRL